MSDSADKRSVSTDALETLGTIIDEHQKRDAIHLAVTPVVAGEDLRPGRAIGIIDGKAWSDGWDGTDMAPIVGIVDPFLAAPVRKGQHFWLVVYPRKITSLRHVWTHPQIPDAETPSVRKDTVAVSERWLRDFCDNHDMPGYDTTMSLLGELVGDPNKESQYPNKKEDVEKFGDTIIFGGHDAHCEIPPEFWGHYENVTGYTVPRSLRGATYFGCTC